MIQIICREIIALFLSLTTIRTLTRIQYCFTNPMMANDKATMLNFVEYLLYNRVNSNETFRDIYNTIKSSD